MNAGFVSNSGRERQSLVPTLFFAVCFADNVSLSRSRSHSPAPAEVLSFETATYSTSSNPATVKVKSDLLQLQILGVTLSVYVVIWRWLHYSKINFIVVIRGLRPENTGNAGLLLAKGASPEVLLSNCPSIALSSSATGRTVLPRSEPVLHAGPDKYDIHSIALKVVILSIHFS